MNTIMPSISYGTSRTTERLPEWLLAQNSSAPFTQTRITTNTNQLTAFPAVAGTALAAAMLVGLSQAEYIEPPTFVQTTQYTSPTRTFFPKENGALLGYQTSSAQTADINKYLRQHLASRDFLREVAVIIDSTYGAGIARTIHVVDDVDTGKTLMELTIHSGLPLNDEFDLKDQLLFQRIEASGLAWGLRDVVISQG